MDINSQNNRIYNLLVNGGSITNLEALTKYRIGRLASRICDLVNTYDVALERERVPNSDGVGQHVRYFMTLEQRQRYQNIPLKEAYKA